MELDLTNAQSQEHEGLILHLGKRLLPIDEYSSQTGLSTGLLEQYGRIGIVQIRKYKGRTFVVDVPSQLRSANAENNAVSELINSRNKALQTKKLTALVAKLTSNPEIEPLPERIPSLNLFKHFTSFNKTDEKRAGFGQFVAKTHTIQLRRTLAVFAVTFIVISLYALLWLGVTGKIQSGRVANMRVDIQAVVGKSAKTEQQIKNVQNQLNDSISQAGVLRAEIATAASELELIQQNNKKTVQQLDEQFAKLKLVK